MNQIMGHKESSLRMSETMDLRMSDFQSEHDESEFYLSPLKIEKEINPTGSPRGTISKPDQTCNIEKCLTKVGFLFDLYFRNAVYNVQTM